MNKLIALSFLALTTCGPVESQEPGPQGPAVTSTGSRTEGSRLKTVWNTTTFTADDGLMVQTMEPTSQYIDSKLQVTCMFNTAKDVKQRCLPEYIAQMVYYTDAICQQAVVQWGKMAGCGAPTRPLPKYAALLTQATSGACGSGQPMTTRIFLIGGEMVPASIYNLVGGTDCQKFTDSQYQNQTQNFNFFSPGAEVDPSMFVAGQTTYASDPPQMND